MLPRWLAAESLSTGRVQRVLADWQVTTTDFDSELHVIFPSRRFLPAKTRALVDYLSDRFATSDWTPWGADRPS